MFTEKASLNFRQKFALAVAIVLVASVAISILVFRQGWNRARPESAQARQVSFGAFNREPVEPLPRSIELDPEKVALGKRLFNDPRLSHSNAISCASCHDLGKGGGDGLKHSRGEGGAIGAVNAPSVFNSGLNFRQFWDGRAATLEEQAAGPVHNPIEMASSWPEVLAKLKADKDYASAFASLYPDAMQSRNIQDAIATFERSLITPDSRFDRFLRGESGMLAAHEQAGYSLFKERGCSACHQGANIGGNMYQSLGVFGNFFADRGKDAKEDQGRFNVTGKETDRHRFKVPSLRNVALTAPYFHDGSVTRLDEAVRIMGKYQIGRELSQQETELIVAFLRTLTGSYQGKSL